MGNAGPQPASVAAAKQSALSAGTEPAASGSSISSHDPAESNFQQAFSSALRNSAASAHGSGKQASSNGAAQPATNAQLSKQAESDTKPTDTTAPQTPISGNQILATVTPLMSTILSSASDGAVSSDSKTPHVAVPFVPKEQTTSKSKTAPQSEPEGPKETQSSVDNQNAALIGSVAGSLTGTILVPQATVAAPILGSVGSSAEQVPAQSDLSGRGLPVTSAPATLAPATDASYHAGPPSSVTHSSAQSGPPAADSLSFALLLHPKLTQGPITSTQSVPVIKQASESRTATKVPPAADQAVNTADSDNKIAAAVGPAANPPAQVLQPVRNTLTAADPLQTHAATPSATSSGAQQSSMGVAPQTHTSQDSLSSDPPSRGKPESASDSNSSALSGFSDIAKPVIASSAAIPNATAVQTKTAQTVPGTSTIAQVLNAQNQAPSPAAKEVVVRLQGQTGEAISVRLIDQGGQVQVAVRSSDPTTANLLRQDLSSLTNNLDRAGWKPEVLTSAPLAAPFVRETSQGTAHDGQNPQGQGQGTLDWNQQDGSRRRNTVADLWDEILTRQGT